MPNRSKNQGSRSRGASQSSQQPQRQQQMVQGLTDTVRQHPVASAAAAGGALAAGVFLWSRREQISDQLSHMSEQISDWSEQMRSQQSLQAGGRSSTPMGTETGEPLAGAGTAPAKGSTRATGGRRGKAQTGQNMSPSREAAEGIVI